MNQGGANKRIHPWLLLLEKGIPVLLILLMVYDLGGFYYGFNLLQKHIRREIKMEIRKGLKDEELTAFSAAQLQDPGILWIKPGKEFSYRGEMFDVVKTRREIRDTMFYCIRDIQEKQLIVNYQKHQKKDRDSAKNIRKLLSFQYFPVSPASVRARVPSDFSYPMMLFSYPSGNRDIHSPPPKSTCLFG